MAKITNASAAKKVTNANAVATATRKIATVTAVAAAPTTTNTTASNASGLARWYRSKKFEKRLELFVRSGLFLFNLN